MWRLGGLRASVRWLPAVRAPLHVACVRTRPASVLRARHAAGLAPQLRRWFAGKRDEYERKTPLEHVLLRPGMYIGPTEKHTESVWTFDARTGRMVQKERTIVPGLFKIFDEILVNAADNKQRDPSMSHLGVTMRHLESGEWEISVSNDGKGLPIRMHATEKMYVPELVFGHLLTGSNFDDSEARLTGGRHGYGAKLTNIFSRRFTLETVDAKRMLRYSQTWRNNMQECEPPQVVPAPQGATDVTTVTFVPDLARFGLKTLGRDMEALMRRRVVDMAGILPGVQVTFNGEPLPISSFRDFAQCFLPAASSPLHYVRVNKRLEVAVAPAEEGQQVSFVNGMSTPRGGTHVDVIVEQVARKLAEAAAKRAAVRITPAQARGRLAVFVNCLIENPDFDSQVKEKLTSPRDAVAAALALPQKYLRELARSEDVLQPIVDAAVLREQAALQRSTKALSRRTVRNKLLAIPKLEDANLAGTGDAGDCTLILTEGDSAKALAVAGLAVVGRDKYGVFPLRGKLLNVRDASAKQVAGNEEVQALCAILGLDFGKQEADVQSMKLRYGRVMIMTDQDHDGSHIKGLLLNFFHHFWPALLRHPSFMCEFVTPVLKARRGSAEHAFFTTHDFQTWFASLPASARRKWQVKYYKGLGTSTSAEAKQYFSALDRHVLQFRWAGDGDGDLIDMAFRKHRAADRKEWLTSVYDPAATVDHSATTLSVTDFIHRELIHFSHADLHRSIPSMVDGLKPSQRKVLFACFKRGLRREMKVAQLAGYCAEQTAYHHGEASLHSTITNMAQDYVGSNNLPLLFPSGQFGTRLQGGKDAASPRYIFTRLGDLTRHVFPEADDASLPRRVDDGHVVEPESYSPVIPMCLVNGAEGIGTGWSTSVPPHNPLEIARVLLAWLRGDAPLRAVRPWVRGFRGEIVEEARGFLSRGTVKVCRSRSGSSGSSGAGGARRKGAAAAAAAAAEAAAEAEAAALCDDAQLVITELPLGRWTDDYKAFLSKLVVDGEVASFDEHHTESEVEFRLQLTAAGAAKAAAAGLHRYLKLESVLNTGNMHMFDAQGRIRRYETSEDVLREFGEARLAQYARRKARAEGELRQRAAALDSKARFVAAVASGALAVGNAPMAALLASMRGMGCLTAQALADLAPPAPQLVGSGGATAALPEELAGDGAGAGAGAAQAEEEAEEAAARHGRSGGSGASGGGGRARGAGAGAAEAAYDYLLRIPLRQLTRERVAELADELGGARAQLEVLSKLTPQDMWRRDLEGLVAALEASGQYEGAPRRAE